MEAIERYTGIFEGDEIRATQRFTDFAAGEAMQPNDDAVVQRPAIPASIVADARPGRHGADRRSVRSVGRSNGRRSGRCATSVSSILPTTLIYFFYQGRARFWQNPTAARQAIRSKKRSFRAFSNSWNGMPTQSGGTTDCSGPQSTSAIGRSLHPRSANPACRDRTPALGARRHQRSRDSDFVAMTHWMQDGRENIEFGSGSHFDRAHRGIAGAHRAESVPRSV